MTHLSETPSRPMSRLRPPPHHDPEVRPLRANGSGAARSRSVLCTLLLLGLCLGFLMSAAAGTFRVRRVEVVGRNLPRATIVQIADVMGKNIFRVRSDAVVSRLGAIRSIVVHRVDTAFPDQVTIYASVRVPLIAWQDGRSLYEMDADGRVIRQVTHTELPVVMALDWRGMAVSPNVVRAARYAAEALPVAPDGAIESIQYGGSSGLTIVGRAGWTADLGRGTQQTLVNRVATLTALLARLHARAERLKYVNLRTSVPYARLMGA